MKFPRPGSRTYNVLKSLHDHGPQNHESLAKRFPTLSFSALEGLASDYPVKRRQGVFHLPEYLGKWFNGEELPKREPKEIPITHQARPFKPLKANWMVDGHPSGRIESRSFVSTATSVPAYRKL